jgi:hypothetical protein
MITLEVPNRMQALELAGHLGAFRCELREVADRGWRVAVFPNGDSDRMTARVLDIAASWVEERCVACVVALDGRSYALRPQAAVSPAI